MDHLYELIGKEQSLEELSNRLKEFAIDTHPALVGAHHVTCSDETERECRDTFAKLFVQPLLPSLKLAEQSGFSTANLGARYEWSSVRIAEHHFATTATRSSFKLMVLKINAHVSRASNVDGFHYGQLDRYNEESDCCGALFALMHGASLPAVASIRETFDWEGLDRVDALNDESRVPENLRGLAAAITQARLQARVAITDIRDHVPHSPTLFLVLPCVTINIDELDNELLVGVYRADTRGESPIYTYRGLGDDPEKYQFSWEGNRLIVQEEGMNEVRNARDHRKLPLASLLEGDEKPSPIARSPESGECDSENPAQELEVLGKAAPVESALRLFARGQIPIHHVLRADRIARNPKLENDARLMLGDLGATFAALSNEDACNMAELLCEIRSEIGI